MGGNVREVIVGYDCPEHSTLFDAMVHEGGTTVRKRAICVFERDRGTPLSRHTGASEDEMGAIKGYELVVRSISTVGNYDYLVDILLLSWREQCADSESSTTFSSWMELSKSGYQPPDTFKADYGTQHKTPTAINFRCNRWDPCTTTSLIVSLSFLQYASRAKC